MNGTIPFNRMPRIREPLPQEEVRLPAPPLANPAPKPNWLQLLLPLTGAFVMVGFYGAIRHDWLLAIPMVLMSVLSAATGLVGRLSQRRAQAKQAAEREAAYTAALAQKRERLEVLRATQQRVRLSADPDLDTLLTRARERDPRLWDRHPEDDDFLHVRLGIGALPSTATISTPQPDLPDPRLDEVLALATEYATVPEVPVTVSLRAGPLGIAGSADERAGVARALLCHLASHHAPDEVRLLALCSSAQSAGYHWLKWLPHTRALQPGEAAPTLADDAQSAEQVLKGLLEELGRRRNRLYGQRPGESAPAWPWLVLLVEELEPVRDHPALRLLLSATGRQLNATGILLVAQIAQVPAGCGGVAEIQADGQLVHSAAATAGPTLLCRPDLADAALGEGLARSLAPLRAQTASPDGMLPSNVRLLDVMGIEALTSSDIVARWTEHPPSTHLQVPIGVRRGNRPLLLDLSQTGHGPHGLVAGTTGSGKSELLQSLVAGLALTHHPYDIGFILVDYKGGGAFSALARLPHTQGLVTDLSGNLTGRALLALRAEMDRRKRLFNAAGVSDIDGYQQRYWQGQVKVPLPRLLVIIDEFAELISDDPDFIDGLIGIARVGRSLGLHLILATQSPAGVVKQQIWANARFRICLRVESRQESLDMLHRPDAADLERIPGRGYLQVGNNEVFERFQVARVAGSQPPPSSQHDGFVIARVSPTGQRAVLVDNRPAREEAGGTRPTDLQAIVDGLARAAAEMGLQKLDSPWPAPLPDYVALPDLMARLGWEGWDGSGWAAPDCLSPAAVLGLLDDPAHQRQFPLVFELGQQDGHLLVIGAPGSGKGMLARTLAMSLAHTHPPDALHLYLVEFGGQSLQALERLPHAGGLFTPLDDERVRRLLHRLLDELEERRRLCGAAGADSLARLRELRPDECPPTIVVVITGFLAFRAAFQDEIPSLTRLVREGGPYAIHLVLLGDRVGDIPMAISSVVARRVVLRLADPSDYGLVLGTSPRVGRGGRFPAGRGWYGRPPLAFQAAGPGRAQEEGTRAAELEQAVRQMDRAWQGVRPAPVENMGAAIPLRRVLTRAPAASVGRPCLAVPVGLESERLQPALIDLEGDGPGFVVAGTPQSGKTTLLLTWALALAERNGPENVQFILVSGARNSLWPLKGLPHILAYSRTPEQFHQDAVLALLQEEAARREAEAEGGARSHIVVMIDDYDRFRSTGGGSAEAREGLARLTRRGRDVGVHIVVAGPLPNLGSSYDDPLLKQLKANRSGFLLRVLDPNEQNPLGLRVRPAPGSAIPPGRGYVVHNGFEKLIQVATPGDGAAVAAWVEEIRQRIESAESAD